VLGNGGSLGLAFSRNIFTGVLDGSIDATSGVGKGSRLFVRFPQSAPVKKRGNTWLPSWVIGKWKLNWRSQAANKRVFVTFSIRNMREVPERIQTGNHLDYP
jgi:hypothetical protein